MVPASAVADDGLGTLATARERHPAKPLTGAVAAPYRGYGQLLDAIAELAHAGARLVPIGRSVRGEPLLTLVLGADSPTARTSVVVAGLHPIEWIGIETALALAKRLAGRDLGDRHVIVLPIANPDGLLRVEKNLRLGRRRFVRHNAHGVDLNRNFDVHWGHKNLLARAVPWVFKAGSYPASEPEVAALAGAIGHRRVDRALSLHSFGGVVLYPSSHRLRPVADAEEHRSWARRIAAAADDRAYAALPSSWFSLGLTMGGLELDWFHERHGALSLLVECSRGGFALSRQRLFEPFAWFNPRAPEPVAERIASAAEGFVAGEPY